MKPKWGAFAFVRYTLVFCTGILLHVYTSFTIPHLFWIFSGLSFSYISFVACTTRKFKRTHSVLFSTTAFLLLFIAGYLITEQKTQANHSNHLSQVQDSISHYQATVVSDIDSKAKTWKATLAIQKVRVDSTWIATQGKVLAYISKSDTSYQPQYGDLLVIKGTPNKVLPPQNPAEFNYKQYLAFQQIHHQHFIKANHLQKVGKAPSSLHQMALQIRNYADAIFQKNIRVIQSYAIAKALVLGVKDDLDTKIKDAYASAGGMHVLAVSGLHVSILFQIISSLFLFLKKSKQRTHQLLFALIGILFLWAYAFVTGLSPSVLRAVTMFSCIIIAQSTGRQTNIYNTLAVSAFALLCWNPYMLMEVGFQLSYVAVVGIVYLQPKLAALWRIENLIGKWLWEMTCVSVAAQVATFPIGLFYFHQFPTYFWLSNFIVIPAATLILYLGIALLAFSWFDWVAHYIGQAISTIIELLNMAVFAIQQLPFSLFQGISISAFETWLIYIAVAFFILFLIIRKLKLLAVATILFSLLVAMQQQDAWHYGRQKQLVVYSTNKHSNLCLLNGGQAILLADSALIHAPSKIQFHIQQHLWSQNVAQLISSDWTNSQHLPVSQAFIQQNRLITWENQSILLMHQPIFLHSGKLDYLIIGHNSLTDWKQIASVDAQNIIIDTSNKYYLTQKLRKSCPEHLKNKTYFVSSAGAFVKKVDN